MMGDQRPVGTSTAYDRLHGAFGPGSAPFAARHLNRAGAAKYLLAAVKAQLTWEQAEADILAHLNTRAETADRIEEEVARARPMLQSWLG